MYDCVYPTRTARFGTALVPEVIASCEYKLWNHTFTTFLIFKFFNLLLISNTVFLTVNLYMNGLYSKTFCFIHMFLMNMKHTCSSPVYVNYLKLKYASLYLVASQQLLTMNFLKCNGISFSVWVEGWFLIFLIFYAGSAEAKTQRDGWWYSSHRSYMRLYGVVITETCWVNYYHILNWYFIMIHLPHCIYFTVGLQDLF